MKKKSTDHQLFIDHITKDFSLVGETLKQAMLYIQRSNDFEFPIIIVSNKPTTLGEVVIKEGELGNSLTYYATYLDFLVKKKLFPIKDILNFKDIYSNHNDHCCILILFDGNINFLYIPYI